MNYFIFIILLLKLSIAQAPVPIKHWIIWNVGQGQWITLVENSACSHFDFGGENFLLNKIRPRFIKNCKNKINQLYLSHADLDHYSFYPFIVKNSLKTCWQIQPKENLKKMSVQIPMCEITTDTVRVLHTDPDEIKRNDSSSVIQVENILIPGDSPIKKEKIWAKKISLQNPVHTLVLGHHGSKTSTSDMLLSRLPNLKMAIASSRYKKYGHPHKDVIKRLKAHHLNVIRTEDWGTLMLQ